jgi:hypothetical protein
MPSSAHRTQAVARASTASAMALLALAAMPSSSLTRGVNAIRSSSSGGGVDSDFLRAHFQAHLLQRDWLPQPSSGSFLLHAEEAMQQHHAASHEDEVVASAAASAAAAADAATTPASSSPFLPSSSPVTHDANTHTQKVLFVTAIYGDYEKTLKEPAQQQHPADFVAFTDRKDLASPTWKIRLVEDPLDYLVKHGGRVGVGGGGKAASAAAAAASADITTTTTPATTPTPTISSTTTIPIDGVNSLTRNRHPFNLAKVFKMQFYRFFDLSEYRAAVWLDATVRIISPQTSALVVMLLADQGRNFVTFEHARSGLMSEEVTASKAGKYEVTHWACCEQPYQNMSRHYEDYLEEGFKEKWWMDEYDAPLGISKRPEWGVWVTCFVAFDLHLPISFEFLDAWWRENVIRTTQDQVTFPYLAWKMKVYPFSLPSPGISGGTADYNDLFEKALHGLRR